MVQVKNVGCLYVYMMNNSMYFKTHINVWKKNYTEVFRSNQTI